MAEPERIATIEVETTSSPSEVWQAITTDNGLAEWMGEGASIEPEVDGLIAVPDPVGGKERRGEVDGVRADEQLDFTWWPIDNPAERSRVSIVLTPIERDSHRHPAERGTQITGTRITVTESVPDRSSQSPTASIAPTTSVASAASVASATPVPATTALWAWRVASIAVVLDGGRAGFEPSHSRVAA